MTNDNVVYIGVSIIDIYTGKTSTGRQKADAKDTGQEQWKPNALENLLRNTQGWFGKLTVEDPAFLLN